MNIKVYGVEQGVTQVSEVQVTNAGKRSQVPLEMAIGPKHFVFFMPPLVLIHCSLYISTLWEGLLGMEQHFRGCGGAEQPGGTHCHQQRHKEGCVEQAPRRCWQEATPPSPVGSGVNGTGWKSFM